jgi:outer membrane protein assembly factor BamD
MIRNLLIVLGIIVILASCGKHSKLLKGTDNDVKFEAAVDYFEQADYYRALQLFEQLMGAYRGTSKAEQLYFYYAYCYYYQEEYLLASYYFKRYAKSFPGGPRAEECLFMSAYCQYLLSPKYSLDQTSTHEAIKELQLFIDIYPDSERIETCNQLIDELRAKLEKKDFEIAKLYLKTEYYRAAITAFNNVIKDYPDTRNKEEILFYILKAYFNYAEKSIKDKQLERYQSAVEAYNDLKYLFPESDFLDDATDMHEDALEVISIYQ